VSPGHRRVRGERWKDLLCLQHHLRHMCHPDCQRLLPGLCCCEQLGQPDLLPRGRQPDHKPQLSSRLLQIGPSQRQRPSMHTVSQEDRRVREATRKDLSCHQQHQWHRCHTDCQRVLPGLCCCERLGQPDLLRRGRQPDHKPQLSSRLLQIGPSPRRRSCVQCVSHEHRRVRDTRRKGLFCLKQHLRDRCHPDSQRFLPGLCCSERLGQPDLLRRGRQAPHRP
jgi:hypothetical protein